MADSYPEVPTELLETGSWERRRRSEDDLFSTAMVSVTGYTLVYEDAALAEALEATGADVLEAPTEPGDGFLVDAGNGESGYWRTFFATTLSISPSLPPGVGTTAVRSMVRSRAARSFESDLEARGFERIERHRSEPLTTDGGDRAHRRRFTASHPLEGGGDLDIEAHLAVWSTDDGFRVAGGLFPTDGLAELLSEYDGSDRIETDPDRFREELEALIRAVR